MPSPKTTRRLVFLVISFAVVAVGLYAQNKQQKPTFNAREQAVEVTAKTAKISPVITLEWPAVAAGERYAVRRRVADTDAKADEFMLTTNRFPDTGALPGVAYEYLVARIEGKTVKAIGYIATGSEVPLVEKRGKVILISEKTLAAGLGAEIDRLLLDLAGDGWEIVRHDVGKKDTPQSVKKMIVEEHAKDPANVRSVFLLGRVPVPMSGDRFTADGHGNHVGAWPADVYYGDVDGEWTDTRDNTNLKDQAGKALVTGRFQNKPGDGKFDQGALPSPVELEVGRVDLAGMSAFSASEAELTKRYLDKNHAFRHKKFKAEARAIVQDNFKEMPERFAFSGWQNFGSFFGPKNVHEKKWRGEISENGYLWGYCCGPGLVKQVRGVIDTDDFVKAPSKVVFAMMFGSYFGDWLYDNNVMRAPLAAEGMTVVSIWAGRPHWFIHHMGMGATVGYSTRLTQNNGGNKGYTPSGGFARGIHIALMGDPTLRMHVVAPPKDLTVKPGGGMSLAWKPSPDKIVGYYVYRAKSALGPYERITPEFLKTTGFADHNGKAEDFYMVRAVALEVSPSGSYYNASQGIIGPLEKRGGDAAQTVMRD